MKRLTGLVLLFATHGFGGGSAGGGTPPALEVDHARFMDLQAGALAENLIRVKRPGESPIYMKPVKESISAYSFTARALPSGEKTLFRSSSGFEALSSNMNREMARTIGTLPGTFPILADDLAVSITPTVEVVPGSWLDDTKIRLNMQQ